MFGQYHPQFLLTRPLPQSQRFAAEITSRFADTRIEISPLMQAVAMVAQPLHGPFDAVIFTSETGVEFGSVISDLPKSAFCVGDRTTEAALAMGFDAVSAQGDWRDLVSLIKHKSQARRLLYLHALEAAVDLQNTLISAGLETISQAVYRQDPLDLTAQAQELLAGDKPVIVPLFSARSAQLFAAQLQTVRANAPIFAVVLSAQVADAISFPAQWVQISERPNSAEMLNAIALALQAREQSS